MGCCQCFKQEQAGQQQNGKGSKASSKQAGSGSTASQKSNGKGQHAIDSDRCMVNGNQANNAKTDGKTNLNA